MRPLHRFTGHRGPVYVLTDGALPGAILSGSGDGTVVRWRMDVPDQGELLANVTHAVFSLLTLTEESLLLIGTEGGALHVVDLHQQREVRLFEAHRRGLFRMLPLPHGRMACAGGDGHLSIWQLGGPGRLEHLRTIPVVEEKLRDMALSPDGQLLAVACGDGTVRLFDSMLFNETHTIDAHPAPIGSDTLFGATSVCFHPAKPVLLSGGKDGHLRLWRSDAAYAPLHAFPAHQGGIYRIAFDDRGERMATASRDKTAKLWDARTLDPLARLDRHARGHTHSVNDVRWADGLLLTASDDRRIIAWA